MNRELYIHTLRMLREQYEIARMDTVVETIDVALWAIETQEQLKQERDAAIAALHEALKLAAERRKDGKAY